MTEIKGAGGPRIDESARKAAAEEAARKAAADAAKAAAEAEAAKAREAEAAKVAAAQADAGKVSKNAGLEANVGQTGAKDMPAMFKPPAGYEKFQKFDANGKPAATGAPAGPDMAAAKGKLMAGAKRGELSKEELGALAKSTDPAVKQKLADTLRGWASDALQRNLAGKEGKDGVEAAMKGFREEVRALAKETGLDGELTKAVTEGVNQNKAAIAETAEKGRSWWQKAADWVGDAVGGALDTVGDIAKDITDIAGDAVETVTGVAADAVRGVANVTGAVVDKTLDAAGAVANVAIDGAGQVVGAGLDAVGADGAAKAVRETSDAIGDVAQKGFDVAGDVQRAVIETQGKIVGGALDIAGGATNKILDVTGDVANAATDVTGAVIADGPMGAAEKLADNVIGPEVPEFMGQIDGLTGVVTNRLDRGDSVFVRGEAGADVGVGVFAGAKINGGAIVGRDPKGNITVTLNVGGEVEGGVRAKVGASAGSSLAAVGAKAEASASGFVGAQGKLTLKFDPNKPEDVKRLKDLLEPSPLQLAAAAANPLAAAALSGPALNEAITHNLASTEVSATAGVRGGAKGKADLGPIAAEIGVSAEALAGGILKMNKDGSTEATLYVKAGIKGSVSGTVKAAGGVGAEAGAGADGVIAVKVKRDKDGNITGISGEQDARTSTNAGLIMKTKNENKLGEGERGVKETKSNAGAGHSTTQTVEYELNAQGLAEAKRRMANGESLISAYLDLNDDPSKVTQIRTTTETDSFTIGFGVDLALGASVAAKGSVTAGKMRTTTERDEGPSSIHEDLATHNPPMGGASMPGVR